MEKLNHHKEEGEEDEDEDRISKLPEDIVVRILSFLSTKQSARTTILSKRWRHLWSVVPDINLPEHSSEKGRVHYHIASFTEWVACALRSPFIRSLCLDISFGIGHITSVQTIPLPTSLFALQTLESLILRLTWTSYEIYLSNDDDVLVNLPNLKRLSIEFYYPKSNSKSHELMGKLFRGRTTFPALEDLFILARFGSWDEDNSSNKSIALDICSPKLKKLDITVYDTARNFVKRSDNITYKIVIDAPILEDVRVCESTLWFVPKMQNKNLLPLSSPSIFKASGRVASHCYLEFGTDGHLPGEASFMLDLLPYPAPDIMIDNLFPPVFSNLVYLGLSIIYEEEWNNLGLLLRCSPNLEHLTIHTDNLRNPDETSHTVLPSSVPDCLVFHLKNIEFMFLYYTKVEMQWIEYLVKQAKVLSQVTVYATSTPKYRYLRRHRSHMKKILHMQRGSPTCEFEFNKLC